MTPYVDFCGSIYLVAQNLTRHDDSIYLVIGNMTYENLGPKCGPFFSPLPLLLAHLLVLLLTLLLALLLAVLLPSFFPPSYPPFPPSSPAFPLKALKRLEVPLEPGLGNILEPSRTL